MRNSQMEVLMSLVREQREKAGMTLARLGELTGIDPSALSRIETGHRKLTVNDILLIAQALGCETDALIPRLADLAALTPVASEEA